MGVWLLIAVIALGALAAGVLLGRFYLPDDRMLRRTARHSRAYMRALNHLLARDHETVIAELRRVVEENVEDAEPYFALAALFRGRGEHERAIRVHQALAVRDDATRKQRMRARYELGLDFRAAGMPRRATRAMEDVVADDARHEGALRALCGLYEEQGRYADAATTWDRLARRLDEPPGRRQHHLLCAAAQQAIAGGDLDAARRLLKDARRIGGDTAHFSTAAAELAAARGNPRGAIERLQHALTRAPELAPYLVPGLVAAHRLGLGGIGASGDDDLDDDTAALPAPDAPALPAVATAALPPSSLDAGWASSSQPSSQPSPSPSPSGRSARASASMPAVRASMPATLQPHADLDPALAERVAASIAALQPATAGRGEPHLSLALADLHARFDAGAAIGAYHALAARDPDLLPARVAAGRLALAGSDPAAVAAELRALVGPGGALDWALLGRWRCEGCGQRAVAFTWRCPACRRWGSLRRDIGREPEPVAAPRERREQRRGPGGARGLPAPSLDGAPSVVPVTPGSLTSALGRVGRWFSSGRSGKRGTGVLPEE